MMKNTSREYVQRKHQIISVRKNTKAQVSLLLLCENKYATVMKTKVKVNNMKKEREGNSLTVTNNNKVDSKVKGDITVEGVSGRLAEPTSN